MDTLKSKEINPIILAPIIVVILLGALYFFWIRPQMIANDAMRNFNSPEAQAKRDPDKRKVSDSFRQKRDEIMAKEGLNRGAARHHGE